MDPTYEAYLEDLARKREPAMRRAERLVAAGAYDEAERAVEEADGSIYGAVAMARLYERTLGERAGRDDLALDRKVELFRRAWRSAWRASPTPHTPVEAEELARHEAEVRSRLVSLLGFDPDAAEVAS